MSALAAFVPLCLLLVDRSGATLRLAWPLCLVPFVGVTLLSVMLVAQSRRSSVLQEALDAMQCGFVVYDRHNRFITGNEAFRRDLDLPRSALVPGTSYETLLRVSLARRGVEDIDGEIVGLLAAHQEADGSFFDRARADDRWTRITKARTASGAVVGVGMDVSELYAMRAELEFAVQRMQAFTNYAPFGACRVTTDGEIMWANHTFLTMLGLSDRDGLKRLGRQFMVDGEALHLSELLDPSRVDLGEREVTFEDGDRVIHFVTRRTTIAHALIHRGPAAAADEAYDTVFAFVDITDRKKAEAKVRYYAMHDALTGAQNRMAFGEELDRLYHTEDPRIAAMIAIDLDGFKPVNDTYGHGVGDTLLEMLVRRMKDALGPETKLFRLGGDEFAILSRFDDVDEPQRIARTALDCLCRPFDVDGHDVEIGASIGIALFPTDTDCPETLMRFADLALYQVKRSGGRGVLSFGAMSEMGPHLPADGTTMRHPRPPEGGSAMTFAGGHQLADEMAS